MMGEYTEAKWRELYTKRGGVGVVMSPQWLAAGCPRPTCSGDRWEASSDCWVYCLSCNSGFPTDYPFTRQGEILSQLTPMTDRDRQQAGEEGE